jgi:hypothetical protein
LTRHLVGAHSLSAARRRLLVWAGGADAAGRAR